MSNTFKIDPLALAAIIVARVDSAGKRVPVKDIATSLQTLDGGEGAAARCFDLEDLEKVVIGIVGNMKGFDIRAGRSGGVGRVEMFKGGADAEPSGVAAQIAARLRDYCKASGQELEIQESRRIANAYLSDLLDSSAPAGLTADRILAMYKLD